MVHRAHVVVVGNREVVEAAQRAFEEALLDVAGERVELIGPGVVVGRSAVGVV
jgi:hypothetical protein